MSKKESSFCETCERCGQRKPDVELQIDPYQFEINGNAEVKWLCTNCVQDAIQEI